MNRDGHKGVDYFIGPEVEHTPAFSKRTLFVVGKQKLDQIERMAKEYRTPHIFLGANHSFNAESMDPYWGLVITALLDKGFWVTLDYQAHEHEAVLKMLNAGIWHSRLFVPLLSVRIPHVQTSSTNLTIKIDDIDFKATNAGVWCLNHHEITDSNRFTDWNEYTSDEIVSPMSGPVPDPVLKVKIAEVKEETPVAPTVEILSGSLETVEETKNDPEIGIDPVATTALKAEIGEETQVNTPVDAAEAYAEGATEDPLSNNPKKTKAKK